MSKNFYIVKYIHADRTYTLTECRNKEDAIEQMRVNNMLAREYKRDFRYYIEKVR